MWNRLVRGLQIKGRIFSSILEKDVVKVVHVGHETTSFSSAYYLQPIAGEKRAVYGSDFDELVRKGIYVEIVGEEKDLMNLLYFDMIMK